VNEYKKKEAKAINRFKEHSKLINKLLLVIEAEREAFEKAGIDEGTVEYKCPICGGTAIANRYRYGGSYHGLGSGCLTCGRWHT
jgi:predicted RNA-binding Zn-ribbon protein involved in translation (DUF1610 family)